MHRDLKSDNIFLNFGECDGIYTAVIGDFDTAKWVDAEVCVCAWMDLYFGSIFVFYLPFFL